MYPKIKSTDIITVIPPHAIILYNEAATALACVIRDLQKATESGSELPDISRKHIEALISVADGDGEVGLYTANGIVLTGIAQAAFMDLGYLLYNRKGEKAMFGDVNERALVEAYTMTF